HGSWGGLDCGEAADAIDEQGIASAIVAATSDGVAPPVFTTSTFTRVVVRVCAAASYSRTSRPGVVGSRWNRLRGPRADIRAWMVVDFPTPLRPLVVMNIPASQFAPSSR
uniref:hypothetical protein n=1 Tax=Streptomyces sp. rh254 TaxID=3028730 RepID=UPI003C7BA9B1